MYNLEKMKNIQLKHIGEDYILCSFQYEDEDEEIEVEIEGIARSIIMTLGLALQKDSFKKLENEIEYRNV